ncbi:hypothetical protein ACT7DG_25350 [Bacillus cereus]
MYKVIAKRLLNAIPLLFVISIISFLLIKLAPGGSGSKLCNAKHESN